MKQNLCLKQENLRKFKYNKMNCKGFLCTKILELLNSFDLQINYCKLQHQRLILKSEATKYIQITLITSFVNFITTIQ